MNTGIDLPKKASHLTEIRRILSQSLLNRDQTHLMARLQAVTVSKINPEVGKAWRNRMIVRSRLRKVASGH
jgi:hypothetical protein